MSSDQIEGGGGSPSPRIRLQRRLDRRRQRPPTATDRPYRDAASSPPLTPLRPPRPASTPPSLGTDPIPSYADIASPPSLGADPIHSYAGIASLGADPIPPYSDIGLLGADQIPSYADIVRRGLPTPSKYQPRPRPLRELRHMEVKERPVQADGGDTQHMDVDEMSAAQVLRHEQQHMDVKEISAALSIDEPTNLRIKVPKIEMVVDFGPPLFPISPTSPSSPGTPKGFHSNHPGTQEMTQCDVGESDSEDIHSSDEEDGDPYFNHLVDNFISAATQAGASTSYNDVTRFHEQQSIKFAESALEHYNNIENNKITYKLIKAITSCAIIDGKGGYGHVNFTAKVDLQDSKEELYFAEIYWDFIKHSWVTTCMVSLEGKEKVGGYVDIKVDYPKGVPGVPVDKHHCYACGDRLKHPDDGTLFESGHIAMSAYYDGA